MNPLVSQLRASARVVTVQPWMVADLGIAAVWFAQLLWHMEVGGTTEFVRADHEWEAETGLSRGQAQRARCKVMEMGWIVCEARKVSGAPTTHIVLDEDSLTARLRAMHCSISGKPGLLDIEQTSTKRPLIEMSEKQASHSRAMPGVGDESIAVCFEAFWSKYPRKVDKGHARKAYAAALKRALPPAIEQGVERYAEAVRGKDPKYIAHAATWLNGDRWLDEPERSTPNVRHSAANIDNDRTSTSTEW